MPAAQAVSEPTERERFIDSVFEGVVALLDARLKVVFQRIRDIEARKPEKGDPGKDADEAAVVARARDAALSALQKVVDEDLPAKLAALVDAIPKPKNGDPGKDAVLDPESLRLAALQAVDALDVAGRVREAAADLIGQEVTLAVAALELPKGEPGEPGQAPVIDLDALAQKAWAMLLPNLDAKAEEAAGEMAELMRKCVAESVAAIPKPKDAEPVDYLKLSDWVTTRIRAEFDERKETLRGPKGDPGIGIQGEPKDAEPVDYLKLSDWVTTRIRAEFDERKETLRGSKGDPGIGTQGEPGPKGKGEKGDPGRDAFDPELIGQVVERQLAKYLSSAHMEVKQSGRNVEIAWKIGEAVVSEHALHFDTMLFRGLWKQGDTYKRGDVASWDGSSWHCNAEQTTAAPDTNGDWTLVSKRGRAGKDADGIRRPEREEPLRLR